MKGKIVMNRSSRPRIAGIVSLLVVLLSCPALAGGPLFWEISKYEDVIKGDAQGISIAEDGTMTLAPAYTLVYDTKEAYIWSSATDTAGNIYLGTGHEGRIFKVDSRGTGKMIFDSGELDVMALATDPRGNLYAGTSPEGKIYRITPDGKDSVFFDPADKYIWSLAFDASTSVLYAGTGDKGVIYSIDQNGQGKAIADTNETNIVSLALEKTGSLLAGTDPSGQVLRVSREGKTFALFDSPMQEIHSVAIRPDDSILALGVNERGTSQKQSPIQPAGEAVITISSDEGSVSQVQPIDSSSFGPARTQTGADGAKGALFKLRPDGSGSETLWSSNDTLAFALESLSDGRVLVGTGNKGRIYAVGTDRSSTLVIQSIEDQTSTIIAVGQTLYATSSNLGRLYRISDQAVTQGTYTSPVRDTRFAGQWGVITWQSTGNVELQTRTGNTESPDSTWSDWSSAYRTSTADRITSPPARFIQLRATLKSGSGSAAARSETGGLARSSAKLSRIAVAYLPRNQAPVIGSINVLPAGVAFQEVPIAIDPSIASSGLDPQVFGVAISVPPRRFYQKGARTLTWQAADSNGDTLSYKVLYRSVGDSVWHVLAEEQSQTYYTIDGNKLPDGAYSFKIISSDRPDNPEDIALSDEETLESVEIDNTPPATTATQPRINGANVEVTFETSDTTSRVIKGEYSVNGGPWHLVFPTDGIADSARESFKVVVKIDSPGEHVIAFRCSDASSNVGATKAMVKR